MQKKQSPQEEPRQPRRSRGSFSAPQIQRTLRIPSFRDPLKKRVEKHTKQAAYVGRRENLIGETGCTLSACYAGIFFYQGLVGNLCNFHVESVKQAGR